MCESSASPERRRLPASCLRAREQPGTVFLTDRDHEAFLETLAQALARFRVTLVAYCLLWNHYHLALIPSEHPLWRLMQQLNSTYCQGFNRRHGRVGHVVQGRYGCRVVADGDYARTLLRYIALNPVAAGRTTDPAEWPWSSFGAAMGRVPPIGGLSLADAWRLFDTADADVGRGRLAAFVQSGMEYMCDNPLILGREQLGPVAGPALARHVGNREFTYPYRFAARLTLDALLEGAVDRHSRAIAAHNAYIHHGYTLAEIAQLLGRDPSTICRWIQAAAPAASAHPVNPTAAI